MTEEPGPAEAAAEAPPAPATARVEVLEPNGDGTRTLEAFAAEFEPAERGVTLGSLFVPWHRVVRFSSVIRQSTLALPEDHVAKVWVHAVVDDGGAQPRTFDLPASRFEIGAWYITLHLPQWIEADEGTVVVEKLSFPWHRVVEFERILRVEEPPPASVDPQEPPADQGGS